MNLRRLSVRAAAVGISAAVAGGALVAGATTAATAATGSNVYTCNVAALNKTFDTTLTVTGALPVTAAPAGLPVKAKVFGLTVTATVPMDIAGDLSAFEVSHARADDFALALGKGKAPVPVEGDIASDGGTVTWSAAGTNKAFVLPGAGTANVTLPKAFTFTAESNLGDVPIPCTLKAGETAQSLGTVKLTIQKTKTTAKAKGGAVLVTVKGSASPGVGKVKVLKGKKVVGKGTLKNGKAKINVAKKLSAGKNKLVVVYGGTSAFKASKAKVTVTK